MVSSRPFPRFPRSLILTGALTALLALGACGEGDTAVKAPDPRGKTLPTPAASTVAPEVQTAVETYLREGRSLDLTKMNLVLSNFVESDGGATCDGAITLKQGEGMPPMEYTYTLAKTDGAWKVTASQPKGGTSHATMPAPGAMPEGHPPIAAGTNPHAGVPGAPPLASGHEPAPPAPAGDAPKK